MKGKSILKNQTNNQTHLVKGKSIVDTNGGALLQLSQPELNFVNT